MRAHPLPANSYKATFGSMMVVLSAIGFGSYGVWSKNIGADFGLFTQGWVKGLIILAILIPVGILTRQFKKIDREDWRWMAVPVLFGVLSQAPIYYAFNHMPIGMASLIFFSLFLIASYCFGCFFMREKIDPTKAAGLIMAIVGLALTFGVKLGTFSFLALSLAAINGIACGGEIAATKKLSMKYSTLQIVSLVWGGILITHLPAAILAREPAVPLALDSAWLSIFAFAFIGLVAYWLVVEGFRYINASLGGLLGSLEVVFATIFGATFFNQKIGLFSVIGGFVLFLG